MSKPTNQTGIICECIADVRGPETVANTGILGVWLAVRCLHRGRPLWDRLVSEGYVFPLPRLVVESRVRVVMPVLAMFPDWILGCEKHIVSKPRPRNGEFGLGSLTPRK